MNAGDQDKLAADLMASAQHAGLALVVPRQEGNRLTEMPAGLPEWKAVVGLIYQRGYRLRNAPDLGERPPLRLVTDTVEP